MATNNYSKITPEIQRLAGICQANAIDPELYTTYDVKRGLRDINGKGVLTGLTRISEVNATKVVDGKTVPAPGELFYRGINVKDMIKGQPEEMHCGFEETTYLLLFGKLPNEEELRNFRSLLAESRSKMPKHAGCGYFNSQCLKTVTGIDLHLPEPCRTQLQRNEILP